MDRLKAETQIQKAKTQSHVSYQCPCCNLVADMRSTSNVLLLLLLLLSSSPDKGIPQVFYWDYVTSQKENEKKKHGRNFLLILKLQI